MEITAAVLREANKPLSIERVELADPKANEVLVRVAAAGFCHTDLTVIKGGFPLPLPIVLGHEVAGVVEKVGQGVTKVKRGDHVICCWMVPCGKCFQCLNGHRSLCEVSSVPLLAGQLLDSTSRLTDHNGKTIWQAFFVSGFATHTVVPEDGAIPIRRDAPLDLACLVGCCVPTGWGSVVNVAKVKAGSSVAVYGCGGVGLNIIRAASIYYAAPIIAVDIAGDREEIAHEFGATHFLNPDKVNPVPHIMALAGGKGAQYVFETSGDPRAIAQAFQSMRMGGKLIGIGIPPVQATANLPWMLLPLQERTIIGTLYGGIKPAVDLPKLADLATTGVLKLEQLVTRKVGLEQINEVAEAMVRRQVQGRWVIVF